NLDAAAAISLEFVRRAKGPGCLALRAQIRIRQRLGVKSIEDRLWIKRVHMGRAAVHKQVNDALCFGGEMGLLGRKWRDRARLDSGRRPSKYPGQAEHAKTHAATAEQLAAAEECTIQYRRGRCCAHWLIPLDDLSLACQARKLFHSPLLARR